MSFANLKRSSTDISKLTKAVEALASSESSNDDSHLFWKPTVDKAGNGMAVIRFLPASEKDGEEALPWVKIFSHGFQGPGGWLIDNCLTTLNKQCPVCEHNSELWNTGIEANKEIVRKQKRRLNYISNIYVVSDSGNPDNNGKVFMFKYGKKIFDKLTEAMNPQFEDETPINPFDLWGGANFKLKIRKVEGFQNYDKSEFESPSPLFEDDAKLEKVWKSEHTLADQIAEKEFKTYEQLKTRLNRVLGLAEIRKPVEEPAYVGTQSSEEDTAPWTSTPSTSYSKSTTEDEDDDLSYFSRLANED